MLQVIEKLTQVDSLYGSGVQNVLKAHFGIVAVRGNLTTTMPWDYAREKNNLQKLADWQIRISPEFSEFVLMDLKNSYANHYAERNYLHKKHAVSRLPMLIKSCLAPSWFAQSKMTKEFTKYVFVPWDINEYYLVESKDFEKLWESFRGKMLASNLNII